jgi:hypothetical protein
MVNMTKYWSCSRKIRYVSIERATKEVNRLKKKGEVLYAYQCDFCNGWHIGHKAPSINHLLNKIKE